MNNYTKPKKFTETKNDNFENIITNKIESKLLNNKRQRSPSSSSEEDIVPSKPFYKPFNKALENQNNNNFIKYTKTNNIDSELETFYDLVPSTILEKIEQLKTNYPILLTPNTPIVFRVYELSIETGGISASKYKKATILEFIEESKSFLIRLNNDFDNNYLFENFGVQDQPDVICIALKDLIELWVIKSETTKPVHDSIPEIKINTMENETILRQLDNKTIIIDEIKLEKEIEKPKPVSIFLKSIMPQIKKQVEFYFSDKNYYKMLFI